MGCRVVGGGGRWVLLRAPVPPCPGHVPCGGPGTPSFCCSCCLRTSIGWSSLGVPVASKGICIPPKNGCRTLFRPEPSRSPSLGGSCPPTSIPSWAQRWRGRPLVAQGGTAQKRPRSRLDGRGLLACNSADEDPSEAAFQFDTSGPVPGQCREGRAAAGALGTHSTRTGKRASWGAVVALAGVRAAVEDGTAGGVVWGPGRARRGPHCSDWGPPGGG